MINRIQEICNQVGFKVIAEIGCDHAYITKNLLDSGKIDFAYLTDISPKCLQKAVENLKAYSKKVYFSVGNGLEALKIVENSQQWEEFYNEFGPHINVNLKNRDEVNKKLIKANLNNKQNPATLPKIEQIIIAGMGGQEIIKILGQNSNNTYKNFILQPQKNVVELRTFLQLNNYEILKDEIVQEGKMFYFVLTAKKVDKTPKPLSTYRLYFGNATNKQVLKNYLNFELEKREEISKQKKFIENETLIRLIKQYLLNL